MALPNKLVFFHGNTCFMQCMRFDSPAARIRIAIFMGELEVKRWY
jgi:hypothetical protein